MHAYYEEPSETTRQSPIYERMGWRYSPILAAMRARNTDFDRVCIAQNDSDVGSTYPGAGAGPKGMAVRHLKSYASWV